LSIGCPNRRSHLLPLNGCTRDFALSGVKSGVNQSDHQRWQWESERPQRTAFSYSLSRRATKEARGNLRTGNVPLGPQRPPSSPKSPGCRSRSGSGGMGVASPAPSCSSSQRCTRARTRALVGIPLRRLWRRRRAWTPSSRRTEIDFRKGPISTRNPTRAELPPPPTTRAEAVGLALAPAASLPSGCEGRNKCTRKPHPVGPASVQRADDWTRTAYPCSLVVGRVLQRRGQGQGLG
jgi:hypothetical protein